MAHPELCCGVQHGAFTQRHRLRYAGRHAGRAARRNTGGTGAQTGTSPAAAGGGVRAAMTLPGQTEAGTAGMQPC